MFERDPKTERILRSAEGAIDASRAMLEEIRAREDQVRAEIEVFWERLANYKAELNKQPK